MSEGYRVKELAYWINERDAMRRKKEAGEPKPWSDNEVMQVTYFCNVHREDDRVTKWIAKHWRSRFPHDNFLLAMVIARVINWPDTLEVMGFPDTWEPDDWLARFREIEGKKWGNAYVITTHGQKMPKDEYAVGLFDSVYRYQEIANKADTCYKMWEELQTIDGLGSFLAAQIVADLKNTKGHPLYHAIDKQYFSAHGPGSLRGLKWFFGESITPRYFHTAIQAAYDIVMPLVHEGIKPIDMQDFQNCLCEFDKFMRVSNGTGRSKRRYPGTA